MSFGSRNIGQPTAEQKRRWDLIREKGCICCRHYTGEFRHPEIHHLLSGSRRMGHDFTIGLCPWHHRAEHHATQLGTEDLIFLLGPSLAYGSKRFHEEFGSDGYLLAQQNKLIGWTKAPKRYRKPRKPTKKIYRSVA